MVFQFSGLNVLYISFYFIFLSDLEKVGRWTVHRKAGAYGPQGKVQMIQNWGNRLIQLKNFAHWENIECHL